MVEKSKLLADAMHELQAAEDRLGRAVMYRNFARAGEVERALDVKRTIEAPAGTGDVQRLVGLALAAGRHARVHA